jgi:AraC-like DNA-binding protein
MTLPAHSLIRPELEINARAAHGAGAISHFFDAFATILHGELEDPNSAFRAELRGVQLGPMVLSKALMTGGSYHYRRDQRLIAASGLDLIFVQIITAGSDTRLVNGDEIPSRPGDIFVADLTRTMRTHTDHCGNFSFVLPRAAFGMREDELDRLHDHYFPAGSAAARMILSHIEAVWAARQEIGDHETAALASATGGLIGGFMNNAATRNVELATGATKYLQICQFIDANLAQPELGPDHLARQFNLSRAALYRIFAETDGVADYIRDRRLRHAFRRLTAEGRPNVSAVGFSCGFGNVSSFIRAFRAKFGITPGEAIENAARRQSNGFETALTREGSLLRSWIEHSDRIALP